MSKYFDPQLINSPFDDPGLFVDLVFERRALLFDLGDISRLAPRKLLRIANIFITHRHLDHFIGFDQLLRCFLGREKIVGLWGPPGLIDAVESKIAAYDWNLVTGYDGNLQLHVSELGLDQRLTSVRFCGADRFRRDEVGSRLCEDGVLISDPSFQVRAIFVDHGYPILAFALQERARINIWRSRVEAMGLVVGPWLNSFKEAILSGKDENEPIPVVWADQGQTRPQTVPLGQLRSRIMKITKGRKLAYVVDVAYSQANVDAIVSLASGADILFIESPFLDEDVAQAATRKHLTARQAGQIARFAKAKQVRTFHYSPRYRGREAELIQEAQSAFRMGSATEPDIDS
jgi:ribonuclease Z